MSSKFVGLKDTKLTDMGMQTSSTFSPKIDEANSGEHKKIQNTYRRPG
jgi:hypothetical protein